MMTASRYRTIGWVFFGWTLLSPHFGWEWSETKSSGAFIIVVIFFAVADILEKLEGER